MNYFSQKSDLLTNTEDGYCRKTVDVIINERDDLRSILSLIFNLETIYVTVRLVHFDCKYIV